MGFKGQLHYTTTTSIRHVQLYMVCLICTALYVLYLVNGTQMFVPTMSRNSTVMGLKTLQTHQPIEHEPNSLVDFMNSQAVVQQIRHKHLREACDGHPELSDGPLSRENLKHILVLEKEKIVYCEIPKVGSTNWMRVLSVLGGHRDNTNGVSIIAIHLNNSMKQLKSYSLQDRANILQNYTKFMFAREPIRRIISAYLNRFREMIVFNMRKRMQNYARRILKKYRPSATPEQLRTGQNITLSEFAMFLTDPVRQPGSDNLHWQKMHKLCAPCRVNYEYLGQLETVVDDSRYILTSLGLEKKVSYPDKWDSRPTNSSSVYNSVLEDVPTKLLKKLYNLYKLDYEIFGYPKPNFVE